MKQIVPVRGKAGRPGPALTAVLALGITQICAWGTTLYALGILGEPIARDTGWSRSFVFGGLTIGLLVASATSAFIGRLIDRHGAQKLMALGALLAAVALAAVAFAPNRPAYVMAWMLLGVAMRLSLYDAAFPALVQVTPSGARRAISFVTLFGGFASSIFWPIGHWLNLGYGWRNTLLIFAAINLLVCLPLNWFGLARREAEIDMALAPASAGGPSVATRADQTLEGAPRRAAMVLFGMVMAACGAVFGAMAAHLVSIIAAAGIDLGTAIWLASIKGGAQVAGRAAEMTFGQRLHPMMLARISLLFLPLSFIVLLVSGGSFELALIFTLLFGISNGLVTIVRGAVPLALFGRTGYGAVLGKLAMPYLTMNALAPVGFAMIVDRWGAKAGMQTAIGVALLAVVGMEIMNYWYRRQGTQ